MAVHRIFLSFLLLLSPLFLMAQTNEPDFSKEWKQVDKYLNDGLPKSARKEVEKIYEKARAQKLPVQALKAQLYLIETTTQNEDDENDNTDSMAVAQAESYSQKEPFPYNAIWHSIAGTLYRNYYENHRWQIFQRTRTSTAPQDFQQWDATYFVEAMNRHFKASVEKPEALKVYPIAQFDPVLEKGKNTREYRPTLYDLLAFRAVDYFSWEQKDLPKTAGDFKLADPALFAVASDFRNRRFATGDTASPHYQAVLLYQDILRTHAAPPQPSPKGREQTGSGSAPSGNVIPPSGNVIPPKGGTRGAFLDADLQRLEFVYRNAVIPDKKKRYEAALETFVRIHADHPLAALAAYRLAVSKWAVAQAADGDETPAADTGSALRLKYDLEKIAGKFPESEGGILARQYLQNLQQPSLSAQAEETVIPGKPSRVLLSYRNVPQVWLRVVRLDKDFFKSGQREDKVDADWLAKQKTVAQWTMRLPKSEDLKEHRTEIKIDALPEGVYGVFYSGKESFSGNNNILGYAAFTVTNLSIITQSGGGNGPVGYVLHRETGAPVAGATVTAWQQMWQNGKYVTEAVGTDVSKADGSFNFKAGNAISGLSVNKGSDAFYNRGYYGFYRGGDESHTETSVFFFTDRSIYRPGQTIYFKAIALKQSDYNRKAEVLSGKSLTITFYDANRQKIAEQALTTNEFGSVSGNFTAPQSGLTGSMTLEARLEGQQEGSINVQVEEYKRPKFYVQPDSLKTAAFALNEEVKLTLKALSYSGAAVDGAQVKYRVVRLARIPYWYWWRGRPASPQVELTQGTTTTRADGSFDVSFFTLPDAKIPESALPTFTYTVFADVSDQNGETHSGQQSISAGYRALELLAQLPEQTTREALDTITVRTQNLAGNFLPATVKLKVERLQTPDVLYRKRLWETPDVYVISEGDFRKSFPLDAYKDEDNYRNWKPAETVYDNSFATTEKGTVKLPDVFRKNGWYVFTFSTQDKAGKRVEQKQYVHVWSGENAGKPGLPLLTVPQSITAEPGEKVTVKTVSGVGGDAVLESVEGIGPDAAPKWISLAGGPYMWSKAITEADRGGLSLQYLLVRDNRVYTTTATIAVPWTNKDLELSWETHRDKVQPGAAESWTLTVRGAKKDKVAAELAAVLYDASLDAFLPHQWSRLSLFANHYPQRNWNTGTGFGTAGSRNISYIETTSIAGYEKRYDALKFFGDFGGTNRYLYEMSAAPTRGRGGVERMVVHEMASQVADGNAAPSLLGNAKMAADASAETPPPPAENDKNSGNPTDVPLRKNLQETAFFMPQLTTGEDGSVKIKFSFPEALTEWKFMAFAHTKDLKTGTLTGAVKTQKDLMVVPGLPRFFRQGDALFLSAKITNMTAAKMTGTARIQIVDALTGQPLNTQFGLSNTEATFTAEASGSTTATWKLSVPRSRYEPVLVRLSAVSGNFTDGEENMLPVVTNRTLVTETLPLWMNGTGEKLVDWNALLQSGKSNTLAQHALTVEYTTNPAWYAIQALPYMMEYPYECAEQNFNRYYATALAAHILKKAPRVKEIFSRWQTQDTAALLSNLEKNQELKSALLAETPWVLEAQSETQQKKNIARLFETAKLARELERTAKKLEAMLLPEGGFPWFSGNPRPDRFVTQYIVTGIGRLQKLGVEDYGGRMKRIADRCLPYLDRQIVEDYQNLLKYKANLDVQQISPYQVQYLYMRSFFGKIPQGKEPQYYAGQARKFWPKFNPFLKGMIGLFVHREGDAATAATISKSLLETSNYKEEMGRYWPSMPRSWWWHEAPIESQALLIEFFTETGGQSTVDEARRWLLKQKQTQHWHSTKATADACYALLRTGTEWLNAEPQVTITLGDRTISSQNQKTEAGTGYLKTRIPGSEVTPQMGHIKVAVADGPKAGAKLPVGMPTWGGVYWQYFEDYDKIEAAGTPLQIRKELWVEEATPRGPVLRPLREGEGVQVGDRVKARIEITVDRDMEYVHLKDARASCFEPINVLSGYRWQGGLGYYESTLDLSSNFFMSYLPKGKYVFEYPMFATQAGNFSGGLTTIQCLYAPEFSAHTEGMRLEVKGR